MRYSMRIVVAMLFLGIGGAMAQTKAPTPAVAQPKTAAQTRSEMPPSEGVSGSIRVFGYLPTSKYECAGAGFIQFEPREIISRDGQRAYGLLLSVGARGNPFRYSSAFAEESQLESLGKLLDYLSSFKPDVTKAPDFQIDAEALELRFTVYSSGREVAATIKRGEYQADCAQSDFAPMKKALFAARERMQTLK
jgi:hypothetical protein